MSGTNYWRRVFLRVPPHESTTETRLSAATEIAEYLTSHHTNAYRTPWTVDPSNFDLTPDVWEERPSLDEFMMDTDIVDFMINHLEMPDTDNMHWAGENEPIIHFYFSGPTHPPIAITTLGYPN